MTASGAPVPQYHWVGAGAATGSVGGAMNPFSLPEPLAVL